MIQLYKNIKAARIAAGLSQEQLAQRIGYTDRSSIAKIEAGKVDLPRSKIAAIAQALHTTEQELMKEEDGPVLTFDDFTYALHSEIEELTDEHKAVLLEMARVLRQKQNRQP